jgi:alpha-L-fucosidase
MTNTLILEVSRLPLHQVQAAHAALIGGILPATKGDIVRELSEACAAAGIGFGVYCSPWDRNHPEYGRPGYVAVYHAQIKELLTGYGPLFEFWFDGANGGDGYYGGAREKRTIDPNRYYRFDEIWALCRQHQPDACIFSDAPMDLRWCGNESGFEVGFDAFGRGRSMRYQRARDGQYAQWRGELRDQRTRRQVGS